MRARHSSSLMAAAGLAAGALAATSVAAQVRTPLPSDTRIERPAAGVPAARTAFLGAWIGKWARSIGPQKDRAVWHYTFVVERVSAGQANVILSWGPSTGIRPGWVRVVGRFGRSGLVIRGRFPYATGRRDIYMRAPRGRDTSAFHSLGGRCGSLVTRLRRIAGPGQAARLARTGGGAPAAASRTGTRRGCKL